MRVITVATHCERHFESLQRSCHLLGYNLTTLGWGQSWGGFIWRVQQVAQHLALLPPTEVVVVVDAFDVVFLRSAAELQLAHQRLGGGVLFSYEQPFPNVLMRYMYRRMYPFKGPGLNAGVYMGPAGPLHAILMELVQDSTPLMDDQRMLALLSNRRPLQTDLHSTLCLNIHGGTRFKPDFNYFNPDFNQYGIFGTTVQTTTGVEPCILHGPGDVDMDSVLQRLGYTPPAPTVKQASTRRYIWNSLKHYVPYFIPELTAIAVAVITTAAIVCL